MSVTGTGALAVLGEPGQAAGGRIRGRTFAIEEVDEVANDAA